MTINRVKPNPTKKPTAPLPSPLSKDSMSAESYDFPNTDNHKVASSTVLKPRPRVLMLLDHYLPGYKAGGPIKSTSNLVSQLSDYFDFRIVTRDRDLGSPEPYDNIPIRTWTSVGRASVLYLPPAEWHFFGLQRVLASTEFDLIYLNSFFAFHSSIAPLLLRRMRLLPRNHVLLAPRGEFSPGAYKIRGLKKRCFVLLSRLLGIHNDIHWHASSELEKNDIISALSATATHVSIGPNLVTTPRQLSLPTTTKDDTAPLNAVFLSRLVRKKNLTFLLEVLSRCRAPITLTIYGPREDASYWDECIRLIEKLPNHVTVTVKEALHPESVSEVLRPYDVMLFPTLGENFGHVIFEALSAGVPVVLSDQTPWETDPTGAVQTIPLNESMWVSEIEHRSSLSRLDRYAAKQSAWDFAQQYVTSNPHLHQNIEVFYRALAGPSRSPNSDMG